MSCSSTKKEKVFATAKVLSVGNITTEVFELIISVETKNLKNIPESGQFFMIRANPTGVLLTRPISIYKVITSNSEVSLSDNKPQDTHCHVHFLILKKGQGTQELYNLKQNDLIDIIGPLGNTFPKPDNVEVAHSHVAIVGGGIGVAPVAGFAETLRVKSYDFYACYKSGSYGLDFIKPKELVITTDDGSVGTKGMLPTVFDATVIKEKKYTAVYACGPEPMLAYVQKVCADANVPCFLSMESHMACGVGACLGCTIRTKEGNKRCCKDGPVFRGEILFFPQNPSIHKVEHNEKNIAQNDNNVSQSNIQPNKKAAQSVMNSTKSDSPDLSVTIADVVFQNPVIAASGTFGYGSEYKDLLNVDSLGGICSKGLTLEAKAGNTGRRLVETPSGLINSIGLENPGIPHFIEHELPSMLSFKAKTIANLSGSSLETYVEGAKLLDATGVPIIELNISCPNVKAGGMAFGLCPEAASEVTAAVRKVTKKPLMVKLSPNAADIIVISNAVRLAGADAISLVNTFQGTAIDIEKGLPVFDNIRAGFSGPAIKPIALRIVYDVCLAMSKLPKEEQIPVVGLGGIHSWQDAVEFIMAGATAIQVGTATFANPSTMVEIVTGLESFMKRKGYNTIEDFRGIALR